MSAQKLRTRRKNSALRHCFSQTTKNRNIGSKEPHVFVLLPSLTWQLLFTNFLLQKSCYMIKLHIRCGALASGGKQCYNVCLDNLSRLKT